jgi:hypothetical protein
MAVQKVVMNMRIDGPLQDGAVLLYDKKQGYWYVIDTDTLFQAQNRRIASMKASIDKSVSEFKAEIQECQSQCASLSKEYDDFIASYKETNSKLIDMVEKLTQKGE